MNNRKRQVMMAAHSLFVEKGFAATSIQDILDESHISKGTFYNYFSSKSELLINIFENIKSEIKKQRTAVLAGRPVADREGFSDQLAMTMEVNKRNNLFALFQGVFASEEEELKQLVKQHYLEELKWMQGRIIELYGEQAKPYSLDLTLVFLGTIQQFIHLSMVTEKETIDLKRIIAYGLRRMDTAVEDVQRNKDILLGARFLEKWFPESTLSKEKKKSAIMQEISSLQKEASPNQSELLTFLQNEISSAEPRIAIIEAVVRAIDDREELDDLIAQYLKS
ncbi:TetR/AcrR family transcriptional regulator [Pseudobacillus sp. FSL P4-0506]|uniref:TetR/AcrR family transcriptional regulator n=1 Tax=unclassified Pseudobacillus TaxID=2619284 RepID=UPI0030F96F32